MGLTSEDHTIDKAGIDPGAGGDDLQHLSREIDRRQRDHGTPVRLPSAHWRPGGNDEVNFRHRWACLLPSGVALPSEWLALSSGIGGSG